MSVLNARKAGLAIGGLQVDLMHPPEMTAEETGNPTFDEKRYKQFFLQMDVLLQAAGYDPH